MDLAPSHLTNLLKGKSGLSVESAQRITRKLSWPNRKSRIFVETVESEFARSPIIREAAKKRVEKLTVDEELKSHLDVDEFQFISQWYHMAILELFELKNFKMSNAYIAQRLGITEEETKAAVTRLLRLKLLKVKKGKIEPSEDSTFTGDEVSSLAIRESHSQYIKKALESVHSQDKEERILRSTVVAIKKDKLLDALVMLQEFHDKFCTQITDTSLNNKDEVYCLSSQFFRLTK